MKQKITYILTGVTLLIAGIAAHFSYKSLKTAKISHINVNEIYNLARTSLRSQERLLKLMEETQEKQFDINVTRERIYQLKVEEGLNVGETASGYDGLAKIYAEKGGKNNLFKAIDFASRALELSYTFNRAKNLYKILGLDKTSFKQEEIGNFDFEEKFLSEVIKNESKKEKSQSLLGFVCAARLSNLYKFGRASSLEHKNPPQFSKVLEMRHYALKQIHIETRNIVDIVLIIDDNYSQHAAATITSLLINANPATYYNFHFLMDPENQVTQESQKKLKSLQYIKDCGFEFKVLPNNIIPEKFMNQNKQGFKPKRFSNVHWPRLIMLRMFLDKAYPNKDRLLYMDVDIVVKRDLVDLFNINLSNHLIAAVTDLHAFMQKSNCEHKLLHNYINSGVLLFNLKEWRANGAYSKIIKEMDCKKCKASYYDQDIINRVAKDHIYEISERWNHPSNHPDPVIFISHMFTKVKNIKNVAIEKPWKQPNAPELWRKNPEEIPDVFWDYWAALDITPWNPRKK